MADRMTVKQFREALTFFDPDAEIFVDDMSSGCLAPPVLKLLTSSTLPDCVMIAWPSQVGDTTHSDRVDTIVMDMIEFPPNNE